MPAQAFATLRNLDDLGPTAALAQIPAPRRLANLRFASAHFATYLRRRYVLPLKPWIEGVDESGLAAGVTVARAGDPSAVLDVVIVFDAGGAVGGGGITYRVSQDNGQTYGPVQSLVPAGTILIDGVTWTFAGTLNAEDELRYTTGVDEALRGHVCAFAAWKLLHNRGLDPDVEADLKEQKDEAIQWGKDVRDGSALLDPAHDATPETSEEGPLFTGETSPYAFMDGDQ